MTINPSDVITAFAGFKALEILAYTKLGTIISDALLAPIKEALKNKTTWLFGSDEASKRWDAFANVDEITRKKLEEKIISRPFNKYILDVLRLLNTDPTDQKTLTDLGNEFAKLLVSPLTPNTERLISLFADVLTTQAVAVNRADLADAVRDYVIDFRKELLLQPPYASLLERLANIEHICLERWDTRERYIAQLIEAHRKLKFEGIAGGFDKKPVDLEQVYIDLVATSKTSNFIVDMLYEEELDINNQEELLINV